MDPERAEVPVVDPQRLNELVGVGQGVGVSPAEPVDPAGDYRVGGLGGDAAQVAAEIRISYGGGGFYNGGPRQFARRADQSGQMRFYQHDGELVLDLPLATEAVVPHRPQS